MGNVFDDSLEWSADDIELTEQLVASADKQLAAPSEVKGRISTAELEPEPLAEWFTPSTRIPAAAPLGKTASVGGADVVSNVTSERDQHSLPATTESFPTALAGNVPVAEARHQVYVPDLEDIGLVRDRRRLRPQGFSVTDFTAAQWCQQQFALELTARLPEEVRETIAMTSGKEVHRVLEAEVKTVVDVEPVTAEDVWALRLLDCIKCFRQLMHRGMTREVYLFGQLQGIWVKGIVDELRLDDLGKIVVVEHKSRMNQSLPSEAQKDTARLQVMIYRALLGSHAESCSPQVAEDLFRMHRLDPKKELSKAVKEFARQHGIALVMNLAQVMSSLQGTVTKLPPCREEMEVRYIYQKDSSLLGAMPVWHDDAYLQHCLELHLSMLLGIKAPEKIEICDDWKCSYCIFYHACGGPRQEKNPST